MQKNNFAIPIALIATTLISIGLVATTAIAQQGPRLSLDHAEADLGNRLYYQEFAHLFTLKNIGGSPLEIALAKKSCGCTSEILSTNLIAPGASGEVNVGFSPDKEKQRIGDNVFSVQLATNDPLKKTVILTVKATLMDQVRVEPQQITLAVNGSAAATTPFKVICLDDEGIPDVSVRCDAPNIKIDPRELEKSVGATVYNYSVSMLTPALRSSSELINIETTSTRVPCLELPVQIEVSSAADVKPQRVLFGMVKASQRVEREAAVRLAENNPGTISTRCDDPAITARLELISDGQWKLNVVLNASPVNKVTQISTEIDIINAAGKCIAVLPVCATIVP